MTRRLETSNYSLPAVRREGRTYSNANERKDKIRGRRGRTRGASTEYEDKKGKQVWTLLRPSSRTNGVHWSSSVDSLVVDLEESLRSRYTDKLVHHMA